ncbi:MAG: hypothetical protein ACOYI9_00780 [Candidatus Hydrogenedentales bacterium]|jgi:hypothetical protein
MDRMDGMDGMDGMDRMDEMDRMDGMDKMDRMDGMDGMDERRTKPSGVGARFIAPEVFVSLRRWVTRLGLSTRALDAKETLSLQ